MGKETVKKKLLGALDQFYPDGEFDLDALVEIVSEIEYEAYNDGHCNGYNEGDTNGWDTGYAIGFDSGVDAARNE